MAGLDWAGSAGWNGRSDDESGKACVAGRTASEAALGTPHKDRRAVLMVPGTGIEPVRPCERAADFKSAASACSAIRAPAELWSAPRSHPPKVWPSKHRCDSGVQSGDATVIGTAAVQPAGGQPSTKFVHRCAGGRQHRHDRRRNRARGRVRTRRPRLDRRSALPKQEARHGRASCGRAGR